jgi:hypothetical protein
VAYGSLVDRCGEALWKWWHKDKIRAAQKSLETRYARNFEQLGQDGVYLLGRELNSKFKMALLEKEITGAVVLDLSFNHHLSSKQIRRLILNNRETLESLVLRGLRIDRGVMRTIAELPQLKRLVLEHISPLSLSLLKQKPSLTHLDISQCDL